MTISGSIYFLGKYRPAHFEGATIHECAHKPTRAALGVSGAASTKPRRKQCDIGLFSDDAKQLDLITALQQHKLRGE